MRVIDFNAFKAIHHLEQPGHSMRNDVGCWSITNRLRIEASTLYDRNIQLQLCLLGLTIFHLMIKTIIFSNSKEHKKSNYRIIELSKLKEARCMYVWFSDYDMTGPCRIFWQSWFLVVVSIATIKRKGEFWIKSNMRKFLIIMLRIYFGNPNWLKFNYDIAF